MGRTRQRAGFAQTTPYGDGAGEGLSEQKLLSGLPYVSMIYWFNSCRFGRTLLPIETTTSIEETQHRRRLHERWQWRMKILFTFHIRYSRSTNKFYTPEWLIGLAVFAACPLFVSRFCNCLPFPNTFRCIDKLSPCASVYHGHWILAATCRACTSWYAAKVSSW